MALQIEKRIEKLEEHLSRSDKPETISDMFRAMERGDYGPVSMMSIVAAILSNGGSGESLRGKGLPDELIDYSVEAIKKGNVEEAMNENRPAAVRSDDADLPGLQ